jgi:hypothetical protein
MQKIRLSERQILMLQNIQEDKVKPKVLKINEDQYKRLFRGVLTESETKDLFKEVDLLKFAQELIVFIKDMLSRPESAPFSKFWEGLGITKEKLVKLLEKDGLLTAKLGESEGVPTYVTEKIGFRRKVKEFYSKLNEFGDAGLPAGADSDPNFSTYDMRPDTPEVEEPVVRKAEKKPLELDYFGGKPDGLAIFKMNGEKFVVIASEIDGDLLLPYQADKDDYPDSEAVDNYVNDKYIRKELKIFRNKAPRGQVALITPRVKEQIIKLFGKDETLVAILNQLPETTGASSSGAFVGALGTTPQRGLSPSEAMKDLSEDIEAIDPTYTHFAVFKQTNKIVTGWEYNGVDNEDIKYYSKSDLNDDYPEYKASAFKIFTKRGLEQKGVNPFDTNNWGQPDYSEDTIDETTSMGGSAGINVGNGGDSIEHDVNAFGDGDFMKAGNKLNKGKGKDPATMPMVKRTGMTETTNQDYLLALKQYQLAKKNGGDIEKAKTRYIQAAKLADIDITEGKKVLKITEEQLKRILDEDNQTKTAYPDGEMVAFDDCTKLNNNKVAQNGGCSQGDDGVVKLSKTKGSVVAEGFNPNVAPGSTYAIEIKAKGAKIILTQDNGQTVVVHHDDVPDLVKALKSFY